PVVHADLYRVASGAGIGLEEYFEDHLCLIEWPDRLEDLVDPAACWRVSILFEGDGRRVLANFPTEFPRASPEEIAGIPSDWTYEYEKLLELFPTLKPGFYNANDLFFYRDYFAYLSTHATQILMARYYRAAIEFADRGEWSTGLELLAAQVDSLFLYFFEKHGKSFPHYEEIHVQREKFRQLLMKEIGVEATDEQLPPEPQTS
ncbi:MAG: tRNA (adenosine(37)-N6)-threonylcarbamoyltransferase complex ATPase subunit type 1 TsaE, partial [Fimbriimonadaceae bacterium]